MFLPSSPTGISGSPLKQPEKIQNSINCSSINAYEKCFTGLLYDAAEFFALMNIMGGKSDPALIIRPWLLPAETDLQIFSS